MFADFADNIRINVLTSSNPGRCDNPFIFMANAMDVWVDYAKRGCKQIYNFSRKVADKMSLKDCRCRKIRWHGNALGRLASGVFPFPFRDCILM